MDKPQSARVVDPMYMAHLLRKDLETPLSGVMSQHGLFTRRDGSKKSGSLEDARLLGLSSDTGVGGRWRKGLDSRGDRTPRPAGGSIRQVLSGCSLLHANLLRDFVMGYILTHVDAMGYDADRRREIAKGLTAAARRIKAG